MSDSDDDVPKLSSESLAALKEFYEEKKEREEQMSMLVEKTNRSDEQRDINITFEEDWVSKFLLQFLRKLYVLTLLSFFQQLSQFWYDTETIEKFVKGMYFFYFSNFYKYSN